MSYRMIHAARRLMCDKFSILCTIADLKARQTKEDEGMNIDEFVANNDAIVSDVTRLKDLRIKKLSDDVPTPSYAHANDAGFDLVAAEDVIIEPGETVKVPTGLAFEIPSGFEIQVRPRSGITSKTKLRVQLGTVDAGYRGEVSVIVDNTDEMTPHRYPGMYLPDGTWFSSSEYKRIGTYLIPRGTRIAQAVIAPVVQAKFIEVDELGETDRGEGGFGSSGVNSK